MPGKTRHWSHGSQPHFLLLLGICAQDSLLSPIHWDPQESKTRDASLHRKEEQRMLKWVSGISYTSWNHLPFVCNRRLWHYLGFTIITGSLGCWSEWRDWGPMGIWVQWSAGSWGSSWAQSRTVACRFNFHSLLLFFFFSVSLRTPGFVSSLFLLLLFLLLPLFPFYCSSLKITFDESCSYFKVIFLFEKYSKTSTTDNSLIQRHPLLPPCHILPVSFLFFSFF